MSDTPLIQNLIAIYQEWRTVILVFAAVLGTLLAGIVVRLIIDRLARKVDEVRHVWTHGLLASASTPAQVMIWIVGLSTAAQILLEA
ncbi:MAG TPA: hypothetical protein VL024_03865, partial [Castellaniella sp.]|nr:hypothetical protein [Castellaniella sp.]